MEENSNKDNKDNEEYNELKIELKNTLLILKKYEEQNLKLSDGEKKLKNLLVKKEKEFLEMENKLKEEIKLLNKKILSLEEKNKKISNSGNISLHNHSNSNFFKNPSSLTSYRDDKNANIHSIKNSSQSNRKNSSSSFSASSSIDKIEKYLKNKISNKNISKSKKNNIKY